MTGVTVVGVRGHLVAVEAHVGRGLPSLTITGLPSAGVQDARDRIRPAVESAGLEWPLRRVVVNLSPGTLRKEGPGLDLPVAMGVLAATAQVPAAALHGWAVTGELSLRGGLVPTPGVLSVAIAAARAGLRGVVVPAENAADAGARKSSGDRFVGRGRGFTDTDPTGTAALDPTRAQMRAATRRATTLILPAEDELAEAGSVIANGYLRLDRDEWVRRVEKRSAALQRP